MTQIAIVSPVPTPYRVHFHTRIARELSVQLHSLFTHENKMTWQIKIPPEIHAVSFEGDLITHNGRDWLRQRRLFKRIKNYLIENKIELVILDGYADFTRLLLLRWAKKNNLPLVLRGDSNIHSEKHLPAWKKFLKKRIVGWAIQKSAALMPMGSCGLAYFDLYGGQNKRSFICPYEPDYSAITKVTPQACADFCSKYKLDPTRKHFLYCGRLVKQKRVDLALEAFSKIAEQHPDWDFVVAGDGPLRQGLESQVPPTLRSRVRFLGFLQMEETNICYHVCNCLVLASNYEPWALVINEACAANLAIVSTHVVGAAVELVKDGENGFLVKPNDAHALASALACVAHEWQTLCKNSAEQLALWRVQADPVKAVSKAIEHLLLR